MLEQILVWYGAISLASWIFVLVTTHGVRKEIYTRVGPVRIHRGVLAVMYVMTVLIIPCMPFVMVDWFKNFDFMKDEALCKELYTLRDRSEYFVCAEPEAQQRIRHWICELENKYM